MIRLGFDLMCVIKQNYNPEIHKLISRLHSINPGLVPLVIRCKTYLILEHHFLFRKLCTSIFM